MSIKYEKNGAKRTITVLCPECEKIIQTTEVDENTQMTAVWEILSNARCQYCTNYVCSDCLVPHETTHVLLGHRSIAREVI